uniref:Uncharacterized protein n=1 Tax=Anguilla anguilla TaxID=7936 RepID=A0A0E9W622_ANGAN
MAPVWQYFSVRESFNRQDCPGLRVQGRLLIDQVPAVRTTTADKLAI